MTVILSPIRSPIFEAIRSPLVNAGGASINYATNWPFASAGLVGPWASLSREGLATTTGATGAVVYGPHNVAGKSHDSSVAPWDYAGVTVSGAIGSQTWEVTGAGRQIVLNSIVLATGRKSMLLILSAGTATTVNGGLVLSGFMAATTEIVSGPGSVSNAGNATISGLLPGVETTIRYTFTDDPAAGTAVLVLYVGAGIGDSVVFHGIGITYGVVDSITRNDTISAVYLPRATPLGLLVEGQATNEIGSHSLASPQMVTQTVTVTAAQRTISFYGTGTVTLSGAHAATVAGTGAYPSHRTLTFTPSAGSLTMTVSGTVEFPQLETGAVATSYIPNPGTGSAVRVADDWFLSGTAFTDAIDTASGTLVVQFDWATGPAVGGVVSVNSGSAANQIAYRAGSQQMTITIGGSSIATLSTAAPIVGTNKVAISWGPLGAQVSLNGATPGTYSAGSCSIPLATRLNIGMLEGASAHLNNVVGSARSYKGQYITGSALQALSA